MKTHLVLGVLLLLLTVHAASAVSYIGAHLNSTYFTIDNTPVGATGPAFLVKTPTQNTVIDANGNLGIGTMMPATKFMINDTTTSATYQILFGIGGGVVSLREQNPAQSHFPYIEWRNASNDRGAYLGWGNNQGNNRYVELTLEHGHNFYIGGGNVGIGTTSPANTLQVAGNVTFGDTTSNLTFETTSWSIYGRRFGTGNANVSFITLNGYSAGRVGISSPGGAYIWVNRNGSTDNFNIYNGLSTTIPSVSIVSNSNVGIGTTTPTQKLDVNGNINLSTSVGATPSSNGCLILPGGGKVCGNTSCTVMYSPNGLTNISVCN